DQPLERLPREVRRRRRRRRAADEDAEGQPLILRMGHRLDLAEPHHRREAALLDEIAVRLPGALRPRALQDVQQQVGAHAYGLSARGIETGPAARPAT